MGYLFLGENGGTNILNEKLVKEAFSYANVKTKKELVDLALREFVQNHRRRDIRELKGKIQLDPTYDHKKMRAEK